MWKIKHNVTNDFIKIGIFDLTFEWHEEAKKFLQNQCLFPQNYHIIKVSRSLVMDSIIKNLK
jgi:hypothetical protein